MLRRRPSCAVQPLAVIALLSVFLLPFEAGAANAGPLLHRLSLSTAGSCKTGGVRSNDALGPEGIAGSIWCRGEQQKWQQRDGAPTVVGSGGTEVQPCSPRGNRGRRGAWGLVTVRESVC